MFIKTERGVEMLTIVCEVILIGVIVLFVGLWFWSFTNVLKNDRFSPSMTKALIIIEVLLFFAIFYSLLKITIILGSNGVF